VIYNNKSLDNCDILLGLPARLWLHVTIGCHPPNTQEDITQTTRQTKEQALSSPAKPASMPCFQALSADHFDTDPDEVTWSHVGTLGHIETQPSRTSPAAKANTLTDAQSNPPPGRRFRNGYAGCAHRARSAEAHDRLLVRRRRAGASHSRTTPRSALERFCRPGAARLPGSRSCLDKAPHGDIDVEISMAAGPWLRRP